MTDVRITTTEAGAVTSVNVAFGTQGPQGPPGPPGGGSVEPSGIYYYASGILRDGVDQPGPAGGWHTVTWTGDDFLYNDDNDNPIVTVEAGVLTVQRAGLYGVIASMAYTLTDYTSESPTFVGVQATSGGSTINEMRLHPAAFAEGDLVNVTKIGRKMFGDVPSPYVPVEQVFETTAAFTEGQAITVRTNFAADGVAAPGSVSFGVDLRVIAYL